jgi:hypothetical protein
MSDFLGNLVERSLASTGIVRPQLGSIFEPPLINGRAFFRASENAGAPVRARNQESAEPANRISQLQSLWHTTNPVPVEPGTPLVAALSEAGPIPESSGLSSTSPQVRLRVDLKARERVSPSRGTEEENVDLPELPGASSQVRLRVVPSKKQQSTAWRKEPRETADAAKTGEGQTGALQPELSRVTPQVRPALDLPEKQPMTASPNERRETADGGTINNALPLRLQSERERERAGYPSSSRVRNDNVDLANRASRSVSRDPAGNPPRERRAEEIAKITTPERAAHREITPVRHVHALSPRPSSSARQPKNPPVAPSINVTIGRVEVRATPPPVTSKAPRASAPILNLDEYLRRRAGGNRR